LRQGAGAVGAYAERRLFIKAVQQSGKEASESADQPGDLGIPFPKFRL